MGFNLGLEHLGLKTVTRSFLEHGVYTAGTAQDFWPLESRHRHFLTPNLTLNLTLIYRILWKKL